MRQQKHKKRWQLSPRARKISLIAMLAVVGLFVLGNGILWWMYRERTYPRTKVVGSVIGSVNYKQLSQKVSDMNLLPVSVQLSHDEQTIDVALGDLGIEKHSERAAQSANSQRSWLPMLNLLQSPELKAPIQINEQQFAAKTTEIAKTLRKDPVNARLVLTEATVTIQPGTDGYELNQNALKQAVVSSLDAGKKQIAPPTDVTNPGVHADSLAPAQQTLQNQLKTTLTFRFGNKSKQASPTDIAKWFVQSGESYALTTAPIQSYVSQVGKEFGIRVRDVASVASNAREAVANQKTLDVTLVEQTAAKTFTYCVAAKGVDASYLPTLKQMLIATFGDARGWSLDGIVEFKEVSSGCNFTVWLSAAEQMPSFGAICDSMWSCRVGPNVVINFNRWQNASDSWNAAKGTLENYRHMVINHETGHWLSFGHSHCSGAGQPAPVMQQQSIDLQGCTFNPWPTASERATLKRSLGL